MELGLPPKNSNYKNQNYWDERFEKEDSYEWLANLDDVKDSIKDILDRFGPEARILQLGCGNSQLSIDLFNEGFKDITNIDFSKVCVNKMSAKYPQLRFVQMDMTDMEFGNEKFDIVLEKATFDSLLVDSRSPWDLDSTGCRQVTKALKEVKKVLKVGGIFLSITFSQPHFRVPLLAQEGLDFSIRVDKFTSTGGVLDYFVYKCEEGDPTDAVEKWCISCDPLIEYRTGEIQSSSDEEEFIMRMDSSVLASSSEGEDEEGNTGSQG